MAMIAKTPMINGIACIAGEEQVYQRPGRTVGDILRIVG
jgi:hypothetical protein